MEAALQHTHLPHRRFTCPFPTPPMSSRLKYINSQHLLSDHCIYYHLSQNPTSSLVTLLSPSDETKTETKRR